MTTVHTLAENTESTETAESTENITAGTARPRKRRRTLKRALIVSAIALVAAGAGGYFWLDATADVQAAGNPDCSAVTPAGSPAGGPDKAHRAVCATLSAMTDAWGRGDATAYGDQFTKDATYTTYIGTHYQGRRDITEAHRALFDGYVKGTKLADSFLDIRFYGPGTAIVTTRGDDYKDERPKPGDLDKTQTYTLVADTDGTWRIAAFQNTKRQRVMERISFLYDSGTKPAAER
jgi:uncharacterized protein (TIGR02246 family)